MWPLPRERSQGRDAIEIDLVDVVDGGCIILRPAITLRSLTMAKK